MAACCPPFVLMHVNTTVHSSRISGTEMWNIMLHRELEYVLRLVRSETSAINSSPWRNPLLTVSNGKVFLRPVEGVKATS